MKGAKCVDAYLAPLSAHTENSLYSYTKQNYFCQCSSKKRRKDVRIRPWALLYLKSLSLSHQFPSFSIGLPQIKQLLDSNPSVFAVLKHIGERQRDLLPDFEFHNNHNRT